MAGFQACRLVPLSTFYDEGGIQGFSCHPQTLLHIGPRVALFDPEPVFPLNGLTIPLRPPTMCMAVILA